MRQSHIKLHELADWQVCVCVRVLHSLTWDSEDRVNLYTQSDDSVTDLR